MDTVDNKPMEETSDHPPSQSEPEPVKESPLLKLRDLRPEKDPMGAGAKRP
jgi:hypothetical protein